MRRIIVIGQLIVVLMATRQGFWHDVLFFRHRFREDAQRQKTESARRALAHGPHVVKHDVAARQFDRLFAHFGLCVARGVWKHRFLERPKQPLGVLRVRRVFEHVREQ